ncbi:hypothetical protein IPN35_06190 [Candidatus Peregrinibacteria bacterium]|nr:MAG: hypothetical protein IPN35_06190 [Candidatus Peregrinibacteria bacterium]
MKTPDHLSERRTDSSRTKNSIFDSIRKSNVARVAAFASALGVGGCAAELNVASVPLKNGTITFADHATGGNILKPTGKQQVTAYSESKEDGKDVILKADQHAFAAIGAAVLSALPRAVGYAIGNHGLKTKVMTSEITSLDNGSTSTSNAQQHQEQEQDQTAYGGEGGEGGSSYSEGGDGYGGAASAGSSSSAFSETLGDCAGHRGMNCSGSGD